MFALSLRIRWSRTRYFRLRKTKRKRSGEGFVGVWVLPAVGKFNQTLQDTGSFLSVVEARVGGVRGKVNLPSSGRSVGCVPSGRGT